MSQNYRDIRNINENDFPWEGSWPEQATFLLNYGILAPSTHNTQPWLFEILDNVIEIHFDKNRTLPHADPKYRDLHISLGCCVENIRIAANYFGIDNSIIYASDAASTLRAKITFGEVQKHKINPEYFKLLNSIKRRKNSRGMFDGTPVDSEILLNMQKIDTNDFEVMLITDDKMIAEIGKLSIEGIKGAYENRNFRAEIASWIKPTFSKARDGMNGAALNMSPLVSLIAPVLIKNVDIGEKISKSNIKAWERVPVVCIVGCDSEDLKSWIKIGELVERLMLEATIFNLDVSIFMSAIEIGSLQDNLQKVSKMKYKPQFLFRFGRMTGVPNVESNRIPVEEKIQ